MRTILLPVAAAAAALFAAACADTTPSDDASEPAQPISVTAPEPSMNDEAEQSSSSDARESSFEVTTVDGQRVVAVCCDPSTESAGVVMGTVDRLQAVGDSILAWNRETAESIPDVVAARLGVSVTNNSVSGATLGGNDEAIGSQYVPDGSSHVLITGGGNDFARGCSQGILDGLITADGSAGLMVDLVDRISADGAQAVIVGYYLPADLDVGCIEMFELADRYRMLAEKRDDVVFVSTLASVTPDRVELYDDVIHPNAAGAAAVGSTVAERLRTS